MPFQFSTGEVADGTPPHLLIRALAQYQARNALLGGTAITALVDNTGGTADAASTGRRLFQPAAAVGATASGSNLADKTTTEAALGTVVDGLREIATKANAMATRLGLSNITYNGGGATTDDTLSAISNSVTGASTGCVVATYNTSVQAIAAAQVAVAHQVSCIARACGQTPASIGTSGWAVSFNAASGSIAALSTGTGTAASPGVTKAEADAALGVLRNNLATLAAILNACRVQGSPAVVAI